MKCLKMFKRLYNDIMQPRQQDLDDAFKKLDKVMEDLVDQHENIKATLDKKNPVADASE